MLRVCRRGTAATSYNPSQTEPKASASLARFLRSDLQVLRPGRIEPSLNYDTCFRPLRVCKKVEQHSPELSLGCFEVKVPPQLGRPRGIPSTYPHFYCRLVTGFGCPVHIRVFGRQQPATNHFNAHGPVV